MEHFGERLKKLRKDHDITQAALAAEIGVVPSAVGKYEKLPNAFPSVEALVKIADYFNVSLDYLLRGIENTPSIRNDISGSLMNSPFIQANNGGVVVNGGASSIPPEAVELARIYISLSGRDRLKLIGYAIDLEEEKNEANLGH